MTPEIGRAFARIEEQRAALGRDVSAADAARVDARPTADAWSVRQIVEHLVLGDEWVGRARDPSTFGQVLPPFRRVPRAWSRALVLGALRRGLVLPLPSPDLEPRGDIPLPDLLTRWESVRAAMARDLSALRGDETPYWHPVTGPLTAAQMLELEYTHTAHHARQIMARLGQ